MRGLSTAGGPHSRTLLDSHWSLCASPAASSSASATPPDGPWLSIPRAGTAAAALRDLGVWGLNGPERRFDSEDWWYRLDFAADPASPGERVVLGFEGLATLAQVWLNGAMLLQSDNMFVAHTCDVSQLLQSTGNCLLIRFASLDAALITRRPRPRWRAPMVEHQQLRWHRTSVLGRTPGWSPPAAAVGPWRDVWLDRRQHFELNQLVLQPLVQGTHGLLRCSLHLTALAGDASSVTSVVLQVRRNGHVIAMPLSPDGSRCWSGDLQVAHADLWWPHTHGEPALYEVMLLVTTASAGFEIALGRVGFRTLSLNTANGDFALAVNGVPIFCRGACWTPLDPVSLRATPAAYAQAVQQAQSTGMNMLRIAGTVVYEDDAFFDACDTLGILVWQDFMFANMEYPHDDAGFASSVECEVRQQLARLSARACLAVLCGNSEVAQQAAMWGAPKALWSIPLFEERMARLCKEAAATTPYWPSSAYGGAFPHQGNVGTTSYYGVGAYQRGLDDARRSELKFATECLAFANIPEDSALQRMPTGLAVRAHHPAWKARSPRDLGAGWDFDDVRDHYLEAIFGLDPGKLRYADHDRYLTLGRMATGEAMAAAFAEWRRPASVCAGALVLMLRDLWAGAGWGLVDDAGRPKACFYYLKRVLQPTAVLLTDEGGNGLFAHVINEGKLPQVLELEITAWRGADVQVAIGRQPISLPAHSARSVSAQDLFGQFIDLGNAYRFGPSPCDVVVASLRDGSAWPCSQAFYFSTGMPVQNQTDIGLQAQCEWLDASTVALSLHTRSLALGVHFDVQGYVPDDAYFHMAPQSSRQVILRASKPTPFFGTVRAVNTPGSVSLNLPL